MSKEYNKYLRKHVINVTKAYRLLMELAPINDILDVSRYEMRVRLSSHDESKYDDDEYHIYDRWFYQLSDEERNTDKHEQAIFDKAFLHHIHENDHHWSYWVLPCKTPKALDMSDGAILEMICDWWSFSINQANDAKDNDSKIEALRSIFTWYDNHKHSMVLSEATKEKVESILDIMDVHLDVALLTNETEFEKIFLYHIRKNFEY